MNPYYIIIVASLVIILSFLFNVIAKKTKIPSVLMLILLGLVIQQTIWHPDISSKDSQLMLGLEILGNIGLIFIVLEAALDLKLKKEKIGLITKSFFVALVSLVISAFAIAGLFMLIWHKPPDNENLTWFTALLYAVPLSIMSSAIIIPSVGYLIQEKKEFMVYESTFSDILGIMFFYFLKDNGDVESVTAVVKGVSLNILLTLIIAVVSGYLLVFLFKKLQLQTKYFLIFSVLVLLYALGKSFHLSSLVIILFFGLVLNNYNLFFSGPLKEFSVGDKLKESLHELHVITLETAFVLRTFFFVIFGVTISIASLFDWRYGLISLVIVAILILIRYLVLTFIKGKDVFPLVWIAPRGLITVLLFFSIPNGMIDGHGDLLSKYDPNYDYTLKVFDQGILLYTILLSSVVMAVSLILNRGEKVKNVLIDSFRLKENENLIEDKINKALTKTDEDPANKKQNNSSI